MKFAISVTDRYLGVFESFVFAGWQPVKVFTTTPRGDLANQQAVIAFAEQNKAEIQISPLVEPDLKELHEQGCEALIVAGYDWKICDWRPYLKYAVNFHPSPLPLGRGPYPLVRAILEKQPVWGITCHQISPKFDSGDILASETFPLQSDECHESLDLKLQMAAKRLAVNVAADFTELWQKAKPQTGGSFWKKHLAPERLIDFGKSVADVMHLIRAFGKTESLMQINNAWLIVKQAVGWMEQHNHAPGSVVHVYDRSIVVAAKDGYIGILEFYSPNPQVIGIIEADFKTWNATKEANPKSV